MPKRNGFATRSKRRARRGTTRPPDDSRQRSPRTRGSRESFKRHNRSSMRSRTSSDPSGNAKMVQIHSRVFKQDPDASRGRILLVDDDPGLLRLLSIRLRAEGYDVEAVESASAALGALPRYRPDLVIPDPVEATQSGAFGFLTKPVDKQQLLDAVERAMKISGLPKTEDDWSAEIITRSPIMQECLQQARMVAASDARVLITGESGTGK